MKWAEFKRQVEQAIIDRVGPGAVATIEIAFIDVSHPEEIDVQVTVHGSRVELEVLGE